MNRQPEGAPHGLGFVTVGLFAIVVGMMLLDVRDSPTNWDPWDVVSVLLMITGGGHSPGRHGGPGRRRQSWRPVTPLMS